MSLEVHLIPGYNYRFIEPISINSQDSAGVIDGTLKRHLGEQWVEIEDELGTARFINLRLISQIVCLSPRRS